MSLLALYLGITFTGYLVGVGFRKKGIHLKWTGKVQAIAIGVLVFLMGARLGADKEVIEGISTIGVTSFILTALVLVGSVAAVFLCRKILGINKEGVRSDD